jgi:nucleotide-binding universal stress UspA family protein
MKPNIMIFTNGFEGTWPAIQYGAWIAKSMHARLLLTGIVESGDENHPVEDIFSKAVSLFQEFEIDYSLELENGLAEDVIMRHTELQKPSQTNDPEQMLILGPFGRAQVRKLLVGKSFRKIMSAVTAPILYIPAMRVPLKRVLICMGGLDYSFAAEHLGLKVAQMNQSSITLLTVVPPIDLDYPEARKIRDNWKNLVETDTTQGRSLREGLKMARETGLEARVTVRHGNIVEQILAEIKEGEYDLVCMGSQYSTKGLRQYYTPNITADVAESSVCPILTVRYLEAPGSNPTTA